MTNNTRYTAPLQIPNDLRHRLVMEPATDDEIRRYAEDIKLQEQLLAAGSRIVYRDRLTFHDWLAWDRYSDSEAFLDGQEEDK